MAPFDSEILAQRARTISPLPSSRTATAFVVCKLSSELIGRLTIHGDKDRRLEVGPWSLDVVAYVVAVLLWRESGCRPLTGIDTQTRTLDVLVIDDPLAAGRLGTRHVKDWVRGACRKAAPHASICPSPYPLPVRFAHGAREPTERVAGQGTTDAREQRAGRPLPASGARARAAPSQISTRIRASRETRRYAA